MKRKYMVLDIPGLDGIQFMSEPTVGRRIYKAGEVVELDDAVHNVADLVAHGKGAPLSEAVDDGAGDGVSRKK